MTNADLWALARTERMALADDLAGLTERQWQAPTLCGQWTVEDVTAHLVAAASTNQWRWLRSMIGARFKPDVHNQRRVAEYRGSTPAETLQRFRAVADSTTAPSGHTPAYLGEVVVHAQDIRTPLGLNHTPSVDALLPVAEFFARRDFAVPSRTRTGRCAPGRRRCTVQCRHRSGGQWPARGIGHGHGRSRDVSRPAHWTRPAHIS